MLLTKPQQQRFWREWSTVKRNLRADGLTDAQIENERYSMLDRAGFESLTQVDPDKGFTVVLEELAKMQDNLGGLLHAQANKRRQKIFLITHKGAPGYWRKIAQDRFHTTDLESLPEESLDQLLFTLSDRQVEQHQPATQRRRSETNRTRRQSAAAAPDSRIQFPASEISNPKSEMPAATVLNPVREEATVDCPF
jgi:hypothetical protein